MPKVFASVILKDNKIMQWKIGPKTFLDCLDINHLITRYPNYSFESTFYEAENIKYYNEDTRALFKDWFRQWKIHEDFVGMKPYKN